MFYDSETQKLIQFTDQIKRTEKVTCAICRSDKKKLEKVLERWN